MKFFCFFYRKMIKHRVESKTIWFEQLQNANNLHTKFIISIKKDALDGGWKTIDFQFDDFIIKNSKKRKFCWTFSRFSFLLCFAPFKHNVHDNIKENVERNFMKSNEFFHWTGKKYLMVFFDEYFGFLVSVMIEELGLFLWYNIQQLTLLWKHLII